MNGEKNGAWMRGWLAGAALLALGACAGNTQPATSNGKPVAMTADQKDDPLEGYNRFIFKVNDSLDRNFIEPVAQSYHDYMPGPVRGGVRNFLHNLREPLNFVNDVLQVDVHRAGTDVTRFAVNTTVGVLGLFDVAGHNGLPYDPKDFGQTLGVWGVGPGAYFVLPLLGPSTIRDTGGLVVDSFADPINIYLWYEDLDWLIYTRDFVTGLDRREALLGAIDDLRRNSFDYYAATRSAYLQEREASVRAIHGGKNRTPSSQSPSPNVPDYGDHP